MLAETKYKRLVWLLVSIGIANGIAEAANKGSSCERPAPVANAALKPEYDSQSEFDHGAMIEYNCRIGYSIEGTSRERKCVNGHWSDISFVCNEITCAYVDSPEHGKRLDARNGVGEYTYFECDTGYKLTGPEKLWCRADGEWLPSNTPICKPILCPELPRIRYGRTFQDSSDGMRNDYQSVTKYTCNLGYMLEGNNDQDSRECQADGTWSGEEPKCTTPRCKHIDPFYGGDVHYYGDRKRWTFAYYKCNKGYHMSPRDVKSSECTGVLEWDPTPPQCFRMATVEKPENGYIIGKQYNLFHGELCTVKCHSGYELYSEENGFIDEDLLRIRNNNGSLEPQVPKCVEKRCNAAEHYKAIVKYEDGSHVISKILSQTTVKFECEPGYGYYNYDQPMKTPVIRKCVKGNIVSAPVCEEARCRVSGYPGNKDTHYRIYRTEALLQEGQHLRPKKKLEVVCTNEINYELYVNSTATYLESFTSECRYGRFNKEAEKVPVCLERRCNFKPSQNACFTTNENGSCISGEFKVPSRKSVTIKCREGYTLYLSKDGSSKHVKDEEQVTCLKGAYFQGYKCLPDTKVQAIKDYFFRIQEKIEQGFESVLDRFTCSFSLFESTSCEDPCLVPDIRFGFAKKKYDDKVSMEVTHGTQITIECDHGYDLSKQVTTTCKSGDWDIEKFPFCIPKPCHVNLNSKTLFWVNLKLLTVDDGIKQTFRHGIKIEMSCANGYEMEDLSTGRNVNKSRKNIVCDFGEWSQTYACKAEQCSVPQVNNAVVLKKKAVDKYDHLSKVKIRCDNGHHFNEKDPKNINRQFRSQCRFGNWSRRIPTMCRPDSCHLKIHEGSMYYHNSDLIETTRRFPHGTQVGLKCIDNFDMFDEKGNIADIYPNVTCYQGNWTNLFTCRKRCDTLNVTNGENINKVENITTDQTVSHGEGIMVRCAEYQDNELQLKCDNGEWKGYVNCDDKSNTSNAGDPSENVTGCLLPSDQKFSYRDDNDIDVSVGSFVESGTTLTVRCATIDFYELYTGYDYYDDSTNETTVTCTGMELSRFDLDCPDVEPDSCKELENGSVKKVFNKYYVSCQEGFSLNLINPDNSECTCQNGMLKSTIGNEDPECIPNNCVLPYDIDDKLSVKDRSRVISLSPGSTVTNGDHVYLNCSKVSEHIYEPLNRRFKCVKGQWIEDEKDPNWDFGNNGTFPKCREALCEPNCTNGGVCYKDDHCKCKPLTEGKRCEIVRCDEQCRENGGKCVAAGQCICPEGRYGRTCEKKGCRLPENNTKPKDPKIMYNIGDTLKGLECEHGFILSSKDSMTCQEDGSWSNIVHCVKRVVYLIRVKTADDGWDGWTGTDANVYIYLNGQSGRTNRIYLAGDFERNDLDETRVEEKDIRPITSITIGHDGAGIGSDWLITFVSIYVESRNEYYVFRFYDPVWVTESKDVELPLKDNCVNSFDSGHDWYPKWRDLDRKHLSYFIGQSGGMSLRACQQKCTELGDFQCQSVHYVGLQKTCWGFSTVSERYFSTNQRNWGSVIYIRSCKNIFL